jgi:hypothetical protein
MTRRLAAAAVALIAGLGAGCGGSSSGGGVDATTSSDPAVQIAALATGNNTPAEGDVTSWRARLGLLQTYCAGTERDMSDTVVEAHKLADEHGADVTYEDAAIGITHEASLADGAQGQDCDKLATRWIVSVATK